jgi:large conductance mechanosensitive channel
MGKFLNDFKEFAMRGNVIDMAVGVIIGGAFGKIVTSLVNDVIMPAVGLLVGGINFTELKWVIKEAVLDEAGAVVTPEATLNYGNLIQSTVDFLIIAFCIFLFIRLISKLNRKKEEAPAAPAPAPEPSAEEKLLTEIRDLLKNK